MKSYRCLLEEWGRLLAAVRAGEVDFPVLVSYRVALENHLGNVRSARARQLALQEVGRQATRELRQMVLAALYEVRRLRSRLKAELDPRDARLHLFGLKPLGPRKPEQGCP
jgi:hypothetical protein